MKKTQGRNGGTLRSFEKGESGNPKGRPKKIPAIDELLAEVLGGEVQGKSIARRIIESLQKQAIKGNVRAAEVLLDRAYGKVKQDLGLDGNITLNVTRKIVK